MTRLALLRALWSTTLLLLIAVQACGIDRDVEPGPASKPDVAAPTTNGKSTDSSGQATDGGGQTDTPGDQLAATLTTDQAAYAAPAKVTATLHNNSKSSLFVAGCAALTHEQHDGSAWIELGAEQNCLWEGHAVEIAAGETHDMEIDLRSPGTFRLAVQVGVGCASGQPLSQAGCSGMFAVRSAPFSVDPAAGAVTVETDRASYRFGEAVTVTIENGLAESIFLAGCSQVSHQQQDASGQWVDQGPTKVCVWEGFAVEVPAGSSFVDEGNVRFDAPGTWRIAAEYGLGCTPGQPLSQAACTGSTIATSAPIVVTP